jgi:glycosyltransferase involved in cell wall biosynthesis
LKKVLISVTNDLATDQRVDKICNTLKAEGFEITLIGRELKNSLTLNRNYKTKRFRLFFNNGILFYAEYNIRLFFYLLFHKKDILLSNDLDTLLPNYLISKFQNKKLVYDSHELFTQVPELINRPFVQNIWLRIEEMILPNLKHCYTVCNSIADYYQKKYGTKFLVIKNVPLLENKINTNYEFKFETENKKIIIYQGALNIGRGLELMIETMQYLGNTIFVIAGTGDIHQQLIKLTKEKHLESKVKFLGRIAPSHLKHITPKADLGISIEADLGLNYRFALPNKIFDYIHAKVPVLVSDLPEMKSLVLQYKIGKIVVDRSPKKMAQQIRKMLLTTKEFYSKNLEKAKKDLNWNSEKQKLTSFFNDKM